VTSTLPLAFLWPALLWLLLGVPALVGAYWLALRRRKATAIRLPSLAVVREAAVRRTWRRHVPAALFLGALASLVVAAARPTALVALPTQQKTIILAMDVSMSMRATDIAPNRLAAAQAAARAFVEEVPPGTRLGLVSFAGSAALIQAPTRKRQDVLDGIDSLQLQYATAIGSGLLTALKTLYPAMPDPDLPSIRGGGRPGGGSRPLHKERDDTDPMTPAPTRLSPSAAIILLTDGQTTAGPDPVQVARLAAQRGVPVYTVGIGTREGDFIGGEGWMMHVRLDEEPLKRIAADTRAEYFYASDASSLANVYRQLNTQIALERAQTEVGALFAALAALLAVGAAVLSLLWFPRLA
jgi:Ca-activated chloride channel family protein